MKWIKFLPFIILILPLLFLYLGISYHDSFYFVISVVALIFSLLFAVPNLLKDKHIYFGIPSFKFRKRRLAHNNTVKDEEHRIRGRKNEKLLEYLIHSSYILLFVGYILLFTYFAVFILPLASSKNQYITYYTSYFEFVKTGTLALLIPIILIAVVVYLLRNITKEKLSFRDYPKSRSKFLLLTIIVLFVAFNISVLTTFLFGIGEANLLAVRIKSNPESAGIIWGKDKILQKLKGMDHPPSIEAGGGDFSSKVVLVVSEQNSSRSKFYTGYILKNIPSNLIVSPGIPNQPLVMFRDNLIINSVDKDQMEAISPALGKLLVKKYFSNRYIKDEPTITVLGRQDYLKFREDQINDQLVQIDKLIQAATDIINTTYGNIANDKSKIAANQDGLNSSISDRDSSYNYCTNAGYYFYGYFYHTFSQQYCDSSKSSWDSTIAKFQQNISDWQSQLQYDQSQLPQYQEAKSTLQSYRDLIASQKDATPQELGLFLPKDKTIKIALDYTGSKSVTEYLETLSHEYLHYTSYVSEERSLPQFFEEGLTEYYARKVIKQNLGQDTNFGYPLLVKIIQQMVSKIPENTLQEIYFNKDQNQLKLVLDSTYGKDFYKNSQYYFNVMTYVSAKDALKFANNIMIKIGGKSLDESDLESTLPQMN